MKKFFKYIINYLNVLKGVYVKMSTSEWLKYFWKFLYRSDSQQKCIVSQRRGRYSF